MNSNVQKLRNAFLLWAILPALASFPGLMVGAAAATPAVTVEPEVTVVSPGMQFDVQIWLDNIDTVSNFQVFFRFDPDIVHFVEAVEGSLYQHTGDMDITWFYSEEESVGTWQVFDVIFPTMSYIRPPGELVKLVFQSRSAGYTDLELLEVNIKDIERYPVEPLEWENGAIYVGDPTSIGPREVGPSGGPALGDPFPNPTRGASRIALSGAAFCGPVRLTVHDIRGRLVRTLVDGAAGAPLEVLWDGRDERGRDVASGVYFYTLGTPGRSITRRIFLVR